MRLKKIIATAVITAMTATMIGCGSQAADTGAAPAAADDGGTVAESVGDTSDADASSAGGGEAITLKVFSNLPDRKNGQGLVEQTVIDNYMAENPNVNIEVEALDEEAYKTKFKAYSMDGMPDVVSIWGQPSFLDEVLDAGVLAELNESDYADYGFLGIDVGGTAVKIGIVSYGGEILDKWSIKTRTGNNGKNILHDIAESIKNKIADNDMSLRDMAGAGIGLPGLVDADGMPDGESELGGIPVIKKGREARQKDGTLAGSVTNLYDCMVEAVNMGVPAEDAIRAATYNPVFSIGLSDSYGLIKEGRKAQILIIDSDWKLIRVVA